MPVSQEQDPFVGGEGEEEEAMIMAPLLVEKLQVSCRGIRSPYVHSSASIAHRHYVDKYIT